MGFCGEELESSHRVAADVRGGHCSGYSVSALTSGVLGHGGDLTARSLEGVLSWRSGVMGGMQGRHRVPCEKASEVSHSGSC